MLFTFTPPELADGSLRLINGNNGSIGLVQMAYNGRWGGFCARSWKAQTARVVCRQLGLSGGEQQKFRTEKGAGGVAWCGKK